MDFVGYAALGGLERVTIVAGAIIIGYWGYRLYTGEKKAGLIFMGLAVLVLVGALATGSSHLRSVGEGMQLASAPPVDTTPPPVPVAPDTAPFAVPDAPAPASPDPVPEAAPEPPPEASADAADAMDAVEEPATAEQATPPELAQPSEAPAETVPRLATGQELGGRIVSVKSENVSLEWSSESN